MSSPKHQHMLQDILVVVLSQFSSSSTEPRSLFDGCLWNRLKED